MSERGKKRSGSGRGGDRGGKRGKWQSSGGRAQGGAGSQAIPAGQRGVFVTCEAGRERRSGDEVVAMLEEAFEQLGATGVKKPQRFDEVAATEPQQAGKQSIDELLAQEVAVLKDKRKDRFKYHDSGLRGSLFIAFPEDEEGTPNPVDVALHITDKVIASKRLNARYTTRVMPVTHTCFAGLDEIQALAKKALADEFPAGEGVQQIGFAVEAELRAHNQLKRMEVIDAIVLHVPIPPHKVNLNNPDKVILVQVIRNAVGLAVVPRYKEVFKFNLQRAAELEEEEEKEDGAAGAAIAKAATDADAAAAATTAAAAPAEAKSAETSGQGGAVDAGQQQPAAGAAAGQPEAAT